MYRVQPGLASDQNTCPDTVVDPEGGITDGTDLALPGWLPTGFPIPEGTSIRHINDGTPSGTRVLTGFIPGGDGGSVVARIGDDLNIAGYEILLAAEDFLPVANAALAALHVMIRRRRRGLPGWPALHPMPFSIS